MTGIFYDPAMEPYYRGQRLLLEQQKEKQRQQKKEKQLYRSKTRQRKPKVEEAVADKAVVAVFTGLQNVWRRQGTLRRTYDGMRSSPEERGAWKQLIEYLTQRA